jgi:hypothetical protein
MDLKETGYSIANNLPERKQHRHMARGVQRVDDCHRPPALRAGHPRDGREAVSGVARPQGVEGLGMVGLGDTPCRTGLRSRPTST